MKFMLVGGDLHPQCCSVAEHLLRAALLLWREGLTLAVLPRSWALTLDHRPLPLSALCHRGDLALSGRYGPPGQCRGIQVVAHGVDQSGEVDEVGDRL